MPDPASISRALAEVAEDADPRVMTGEVWSDLCRTLEKAGRFVLGDDVPDSPNDRAEGFRYLLRFLAAGINACVEHSDPDVPEFGRMMDWNERWGLDNPDCLYLISTIRGDAAYRIHGRLGGAHHLDVQVNAGHYAYGTVAAVKTIASLNLPQLERGEGGTIEIFLGGPPRETNWIPLADDAQFVLLRQLFLDWEREEPGHFLIERVGGEVTIPRPRTDQIAERIDRLRSWLDVGGQLWENMSKVMVNREPNSLIVGPPEASGEHSGTAGQSYGMGNFHCGEDEAVILEFAPPPCHYWSVSLATWWWEAIDPATRQSSLNGHQARLDDDGRFRAVISHDDPGVPNWLDTAGHTKGTAIVRLIDAEAALEPIYHVVPRSEVLDHLPTTARVPPDERQRLLARRRDAFATRYRR